MGAGQWAAAQPLAASGDSVFAGAGWHKDTVGGQTQVMEKDKTVWMGFGRDGGEVRKRGEGGAWCAKDDALLR